MIVLLKSEDFCGRLLLKELVRVDFCIQRESITKQDLIIYSLLKNKCSKMTIIFVNEIELQRLIT